MGLSSSTIGHLQTISRPGAVLAALEARLDAERHQLPLFIPVFLALGIGLWFALPDAGAWRAAMLAGLAAALCGVLLAGRAGHCLIIGGLLAALGLGLAWGHSIRAAAPVLSAERFALTFRAEIVAVEGLEARDRTRLLLAPLSHLPADMRVRVSFRGALPAPVRPGARIRLRATVSPPPGPAVPGGYHFARRAWFEGIGATGYALGPPEILAPAPPQTGFAARLSALRAGLTRMLQRGVGGRAGGVAAALVTGDRGGIQPDVTEAMRDSGLAHLIAISGLHIAVVVGGAFWTVRRLLVRWTWFARRYDARLAASVAAAVAGIAYTLIAGAGVPTVRACIAVLLVLLGLVMGREALSLRMVAAGATLILLWRPDYLLSPSFQLSFAAVTGIVALYQSPLGRRWSERRAQDSWPGRFRRGVAALFLTGIAAELTIGPVALYHFNQMGLYGAGANLFAIPLTSFVIIPLLVVAVIAGPLGVAGPVFTALAAAIDILIGLAERTAALPGAVALFPAIPTTAFIVAVAGGIWLCLWQTGWRWWGLAGPALGALLAVTAPRPDLFVGPDGQHLAVSDGDMIYMLRPRAGDYITDMWTGAAGAAASVPLSALSGAACSADACTAVLTGGGRDWRLLATRSKRLISRDDLAPVCAASDIIVSARYLPAWCRARWLTLDAAGLAHLGAVSIDLANTQVRSAAGEDGAHPWARH